VAEPLFVSQQRLERWIEKGEVEFDDGILTLVENRASYRMEPATHVQTLLDGSDNRGWIGRIITLEALQQAGAEHFQNTIIDGETGYQCEDGFVGKQLLSAPAVQPLPVPAAPATPPQAPAPAAHAPHAMPPGPAPLPGVPSLPPPPPIPGRPQAEIPEAPPAPPPAPPAAAPVATAVPAPPPPSAPPPPPAPQAAKAKTESEADSDDASAEEMALLTNFILDHLD